MGKLGLTAREIGSRINASAEVVNRLLVEKGFLDGSPGAYFVTEAGKAFGVDRSALKNNSFDTFEWANWSESVIDELGATPEAIAELTASLKAAKEAKRLADRIEAEEYWAGVAAAKLGKIAVTDGEPNDGLTNGQKVAIAVGVTVVVVVGGVVFYKVVKRRKQKQAEREASASK